MCFVVVLVLSGPHFHGSLLDKLKITHRDPRSGLTCDIICFIVIALLSRISIGGGSESAHGSKVFCLFVHCSAPFLTWFKYQQTSRRFTARSYLNTRIRLTIHNLKDKMLQSAVITYLKELFTKKKFLVWIFI